MESKNDLGIRCPVYDQPKTEFTHIENMVFNIRFNFSPKNLNFYTSSVKISMVQSNRHDCMVVKVSRGRKFVRVENVYVCLEINAFFNRRRFGTQNE
jgi:hypothetical protein